MKNAIYSVFMICVFAMSCANEGKQVLPILGERDVINNDTIYHTIPNFSFIDQDSQVVNNATFDNKIYVVDFFFTSCPSICPKTLKQMLRIYDKYQNNDNVLLLAHSIDTRHDSVPVLKRYADKINISSKKWHLVTGKKEDIYGIADDYFSVAIEDPNSPGGYDHSGKFVLVDTKKRIRSFCDGTDPNSVDKFMKDIDLLLDESYAKK